MRVYRLITNMDDDEPCCMYVDAGSKEEAASLIFEKIENGGAADEMNVSSIDDVLPNLVIEEKGVVFGTWLIGPKRI